MLLDDREINIKFNNKNSFLLKSLFRLMGTYLGLILHVPNSVIDFFVQGFCSLQAVSECRYKVVDVGIRVSIRFLFLCKTSSQSWKCQSELEKEIYKHLTSKKITWMGHLQKNSPTPLTDKILDMALVTVIIPVKK